jgi:hypothetical protein
MELYDTSTPRSKGERRREHTPNVDHHKSLRHMSTSILPSDLVGEIIGWAHTLVVGRYGFSDLGPFISSIVLFLVSFFLFLPPFSVFSEEIGN